MSRSFSLQHIGRPLRYLAVGGGLALVYSALVASFVMTRQVSDPTMASVLATLMTQPLAFFSHRAITYADVSRNGRQLTRFTVVATTTFIVGVGTMKVVTLMAWPFWVALVIGWFLVPAANFLVSTLWVFEAKSLLSLGRVATSAQHVPPAKEGPPDERGN